MANQREAGVTVAFVSLASALVTGYDVVDLLDTLTSSCAELLDIASAGLLLADTDGVLHVLAASTENTRHLETFQVQRDQGPCLDCFHTGQSVSVADLHAERERWPEFARAAETAGFVSVHALPLRLQNTVLGVMGLFGSTAGALAEEDLRLAQALADVASVALIQQKAATDRDIVVEQLQTALSSRVVIEQAKGVVAQQGSVDMNQAFTALRRYARDRNLKLSDAANAVVSRSLPARRVIEHAQSVGLLPR